MYYFLELQTLSGRRMRLSFKRMGGGLKLIQQQLEGGGRLAVHDSRQLYLHVLGSADQ